MINISRLGLHGNIEKSVEIKKKEGLKFVTTQSYMKFEYLQK